MTHSGHTPRKSPTGISGFDELTGGGLPHSRITVVLGSAGAGKTVFSLQTLVNAAARGEPGIFVAFEEDTRRIRENADSFGWKLDELEQERLLFVDAYVSPTDPMSGDFDLGGVLAQVAQQVETLGARRVVFDGIDVLLALLEGPGAARRELFRLFEWLAARDLTCILTAKAEGPDPLASPQYGYLPFMADCVILLQHALRERVSVRGIRVVKYRGSGFSENEFPVVITGEGMEVATYGRADLTHPVSSERISTGVAELDDMLDGGYFRGSSILLTGAPGVAKTTLSGSFADASCARGERVLFLSFDEPADQIVRNLSSVGLGLGRWVQEGLLDIWSLRSEARGVEEHLIEIKKRLLAFRPRALVVDPLSALAKSGGEVAAVDGSLRLLDFAKSQGITVLCTSLQEGSDPLSEQSSLQVSTIADTWFHLSYHVRGGERNRALTVVKSRGMAHSNQVREMILTRHGITLADVYSAGGDVLMGTARYEKEEEERRLAADAAAGAEERRRDLERAEAELRGRMAAMQRELAALEVQREAAGAKVQRALDEREAVVSGILRRRGAEPAREPGQADQP
ncbi:MAG TPA: circadian clock protein KaiC [Longimicrobium sp.]|jgi:circadian clock protein KaiC|uniref:circadian clock protein KaiC n=1 Tax=Longimicrobium sp. TaxID=2029185 RepID=UPI002EDB4C92